MMTTTSKSLLLYDVLSLSSLGAPRIVSTEHCFQYLAQK